MRAVTIHQPWASLVAVGIKTVETRSRRVTHRGPLLIHAGQRMWDAATYQQILTELDRSDHPPPGGSWAVWLSTLELGVVVAIADLSGVLPADRALRDRPDQAPWGWFGRGRHGWMLDDVRPVAPPVPARGRQGLWIPDDQLIARLGVSADG
ncbi:ASCH domain-containing protein [Euzebya rosea]|uniref:ASCH domain-containing protein n=1 Tax=Euzebya rosea TaxID=2052804 RepID=UPI00130047F5|nr:ASCH domain-containing protein [Euzebya rosea]